MRQKFSLSWKGSRQKRKQVKFRANAPLHIATIMLSANLSKSLRKTYGKRNIPLRKEDEVKIMVGEFKGKTGKIGIVNRKKKRVSIEGIQRKKKDGTKINVYFDPSNLQIQNLNLNDKKRIKALNRKFPEKKKAKEGLKAKTQTNDKTKNNVKEKK